MTDRDRETEARCDDLDCELSEAVPDLGHTATLHHNVLHWPGQVPLLRSLLCRHRIHIEVPCLNNHRVDILLLEDVNKRVLLQVSLCHP